MSYLALYRAFRPKTFDEIIGQEHIVRTLVNQIKSNKIGHAYLFCGARGTGKTTAAKVFARAINCLSPVNGSPCGQCEACKKLENPANLDIVEMDAASNNKVENVRDIRDKVQYPPVAGKYKVYIIDEVHMLTTEAFNALLKTLEEPPAHAVFILATTEVHKLPATILSRCLRFDFKLIPTPTIAKLIAGIYDKIGKKYTPEAVNAIARAGEGSVRDALSVADVCVSYSDGELTYDDVIEVLGTSDRTHIEKLISEIVGGNTGGILSVVDELCMHGKSVAVLNRDVCNAIRDLLVIKTCTDPQAILGLPKDKLDELKKLADKTDVHALLRYLELFSAAEADLKYSTHPRIVFETAAVKAGMPQADYNIDALLARMSAMEKQLQELSARPVVLPLTNNERPVAVEGEKPTSVKTETVKPTVKEHFRKYLAFKARSVIKSLFKALIARLSALAEVAQEIAEHHIGRILYDCVVHIHKCFRLDPIVAVNKADIVTARGRNSRLSCAEQTAVLLMHDLHTGILSRIFVANLGAAIGRAVVDNNYFHIIECLRRKALEALTEIFFDFIYRHYNAYHNSAP